MAASKWTPVDGEALFHGPGIASAVSGGTAAFFKVTLKEPHPDTGSTGFWIAKDLAHAQDEVEFYEIALKRKGLPGWRLMDYLIEYKGVAKMACASEKDKKGNGKELGTKELLIMRNLFDGKTKLRLLDIKIGEVTADANWRGKSTYAAYKQSILDAQTNSSREGYRMEGFDGAPAQLMTFDPSAESSVAGTLFSARKSKRFQYQNMPAKRFLSWFLDTRELTGHAAYNPDTHASPCEYSEVVLRSLATSLAQLCRGLRELPVPQKWLGSSVALLFEAGKLPERGPALEAAAKGAATWIFDWGRSELNLEPDFEKLSHDEQMDRVHFWNLYCDGVTRLFYETLRCYFHRFSTREWKAVLVEIMDYDSLSQSDFIGKVVIPLEETNGKKQFTIVGADGNHVQKKHKDCNLSVTVSKRQERPSTSSDGGSRVLGGWLVTIHGADQVPNMDKAGYEWMPNLTGSKSDAFCIVTAMTAANTATAADGLRTSPVAWSKCCMNTNHPVFEETFEFGLCDNENFVRLLSECDIGPATSEQLNTWFPAENPDCHKTEQDSWKLFSNHLDGLGFGSAFKQGLPQGEAPAS